MIIGCGQQGAIVSMVERASKLIKLAKIPAKLADMLTKVMLIELGPIKEWVLTLTADNGMEFAGHQKAVETAILYVRIYTFPPNEYMIYRAKKQ